MEREWEAFSNIQWKILEPFGAEMTMIYFLFIKKAREFDHDSFQA